MQKRKTTEEFKKEVYDLVGNEYAVIGEYKDSRDKIKMKHNKCKCIYRIEPRRFISGTRCPWCYSYRKNNIIKPGITKEKYMSIGQKKKTTKEFKKEVYDLVGNEYIVIGEYKDSRDKIKMKHNKCGNIYEVIPTYFLSGTRCPYCSHRHKYTTEEFKKKVYDSIGNKYTVLSKYKGANNKIKIKHNKCGNTYEQFANDFLYNHRCPYCSHRHKYTTEEFKKKVYDLVGDEYTLLSKYISSKVKVKMKHNKCGNIYEVNPSVFLYGTRCPYCANKHKYTQKEFENKVYDLVGDEYTVLSKYISSKEKIKMKHNKCGNIYEVQATSFLSGRRCPYCSHAHRYTQKEFEDKIYDLVGNEYTVLSKYVNAKVKVKMKHNKCGNIYEVNPGNFLYGSRCPYCSHRHKYTTEEFKKKVYDLVGNEYTVLSEYVGSKEKIKMKHNKCGNTYRVIPTSFLSGTRCPYCAHKHKYTKKIKR